MKRSNIWLLLTPFFSLLIVVGIGIYASVRAAALSQAFPFSCFEGACWSWSWEAGVFYVVFVGLVLIVYLQIASQVDQQNETVQLLAETRTLVDTAPPKRVLTYVHGKYLRARGTISALGQMDKVEDQNVAYAIRVVLRGMLDVAHYWDRHTDESSRYHYRATIMLIDSAEQYAPAEQRQILQAHIRFADRNAIAAPEGWQHFDLYLRTATEFNTCNRQSAVEPDNSIQPLILGVKAPVNRQNSPDQMVVGAPFSVYYGHTQYIPDTAKIAAKLQGKGYFLGLKSEIEQFYREDHHAKSILSIPLPVQFEQDDCWAAENCPYVAVVNIFRDEVNMFGGNNEFAEQYSALMAPFCDMLAELLLAYLDASEQE